MPARADALDRCGPAMLQGCPAKLCVKSTWVGVVAPAEDAFVGAGQRRRGLHAAVALNAVEGVLVAAAAPAQHALRPAAQLHATVRSCAASP